ncbi:MAG: protein-glutamate O-methyltransferase CheR [Legionella sp.]|nr:protein-glutamate O-methyltransferase CheR [Legionella sp.]
MNDMISPLINEIKNLEHEFIGLVQQRFGIVIHMNQTQTLIDHIAQSCALGKMTPRSYLQQLQMASNKSPEVSQLVAAITVGESYFFRDASQMTLLQEHLLPRLIKKNEQSQRLKIWSAGCAAGEEIYTVLMQLQELLPNCADWDLQLLATDINTEALAKAQSGLYGEWSMRTIPRKYLQRYFIKDGQKYLFQSPLRERVHFAYLNLIDHAYPSILTATIDIDLILCRNVLIYFANDTGVNIVRNLSHCMAPEAVLLLGASDPIVTPDTGLQFHHNGAIYFTRAEISP